MSALPPKANIRRRRRGNYRIATGFNNSGSWCAAEKPPWRVKYRRWSVWCWCAVLELAGHGRRVLTQFLVSPPSTAWTTRERPHPGESYDPKKFTCAHRTLPFGTRLRVTDSKSSRSVVVTVNDRGPFTKGRVIDLSLAAAKALRMTGRGLMKVTATGQ